MRNHMTCYFHSSIDKLLIMLTKVVKNILVGMSRPRTLDAVIYASKKAFGQPQTSLIQKSNRQKAFALPPFFAFFNHFRTTLHSRSPAGVADVRSWGTCGMPA